jgi:hypothetical protein
MNSKPNFESIVERAKLEILADVENGTHPALVQCFSDLHSFADANAYGGGDDETAYTAFWQQVHERLDAWIKTGVLGRAMSDPECAGRAQRALEYYSADLGEHGPIDFLTIRDLLHDTLHWLAQQPPPNDYQHPVDTLTDALHAALIDFPEGRRELEEAQARINKIIGGG